MSFEGFELRGRERVREGERTGLIRDGRIEGGDDEEPKGSLVVNTT